MQKEFHMLQRIEGTYLSFFCEAERKHPRRRRAWFLCDCGKGFETDIHNVKPKGTTSCGCMRLGRPRINTELCKCGYRTASYSLGMCRNCYEKRLRLNNPEFAEKQRQNQKVWAERNPDKIKKHQEKRQTDPKARKRDKETKRAASLRQLGTNINEVEEYSKSGCEICGTHKHLHVDHDHKTGQFRGILCSKHNNGLGFLGDNIEGLEKALDYLRNAERRTQRRFRQNPA